MRSFVLCLALAAAPASADVSLFATPSGNIQCAVGLESASADIECSIVERTGPPASPRPSACTDTWGHFFILRDTGPAQVLCSAPPQRLDIGDVAPYGQTAVFNDITCRSERTGLECRNASGNGFFLSRREQRVF